MSRTVQAIEADIQAIKDGNPNWFNDAGAMALIKSFNDLIIERERIGTASGESPYLFLSTNEILSSYKHFVTHLSLFISCDMLISTLFSLQISFFSLNR